MRDTALSFAEERICDAFPTGAPVELRGDTSDRVVRAEVLVRILTGELRRKDEQAPRPALRLTSAVVTGAFDLAETSINSSLSFRNCTFVQELVLEDSAVRSLRLPGSTVPGFEARNLRVQGNLELNEGFHCPGTVTLVGARVEGDLRLNGAVLGAESGNDSDTRALAASRLHVSGALLARDLTAYGQVRLISARIDGLCSFLGASLVHPEGIALQGERIEVGEGVLLGRGFRAEGRVFFQNAQLGGGFDGLGSTFAGGTVEKPALQLVRARVARNISLIEATIHGSVGMRSATVGGEVVLRKTTFEILPSEGKGGEAQSSATSIDARHLTAVALDLRCAAPPTTIDLRHARLELIRDASKSWPEELLLESCTFDRVEGDTDDIDVHERLKWLDLGPHYRPQPYDQLRTAYLAAGDEQAARRVALAKERRRRETLSPAGRTFGYVQDATVGYGYRPWLAAVWVCVLALTGAFVFSNVRPAPDAGAPAFAPAVYALDVLLPVVDLGQADAFTPESWTRWVAWGLILSGWVLTSAVVAGLARLLTRP